MNILILDCPISGVPNLGVLACYVGFKLEEIAHFRLERLVLKGK